MPSFGPVPNAQDMQPRRSHFLVGPCWQRPDGTTLAAAERHSNSAAPIASQGDVEQETTAFPRDAATQYLLDSARMPEHTQLLPKKLPSVNKALDNVPD
eukprot:CAMPEP_0172747312 /NCGR_PEP_ID=MMETSP1074-20121228/142504_1 /TAXON_ID=2916 /ORGANISM="Ceratium fusus, Strain PA161109" /LENGTH=98 /DNA_ID=CAMNT_0013578811 /DNA_START=197 /DNA_END=494 /DNA_ORIENTATION=-